MKILTKILSSEFKSSSIPKKIFKAASLIAIFFLAFKPATDPDLFWHLKTGEIMWQYKIIPHVDWFSYTMSNYPRIDFEWLSEILMYKIWHLAGYSGLAIFFALILVLTFGYLIPMSMGKNSLFYATHMAVLLGALVASVTFGSRPQMFTIAGIALIFFIINRLRANSRDKISYFLPPVFLLWTNLHGGFLFGLILLGGFLFLEKYLIAASLRNPNGEWLKFYAPMEPLAWKRLAQSAVISFAATFINPYTYRLYGEVYRAISDTYDKNAIAEWLAPNFHTPEGMLFGFYVIFIVIMILLVKKTDVLSFALIPLSLFAAFQAYRNIPIFVIMSLPMLARCFEPLEKSFAGTFQKKFIALSFSALLIFYPPFVMGTGNAIKTFGSEEKLAEFGQYPLQAIRFMEKHPDKLQKNIFNNYGWGGYLIANGKWQMANGKVEGGPKVFIDGRMSFWKLGDRQILKDYYDINAVAENWETLVSQYQIKIALSRKDDFLPRALSLSPEWKKIYEDDISIIYEKK